MVDTKTNTGYPITDIIDDGNFKIAPGITTANFSDAYVAPLSSFYVATLESVAVRQNFSIKCFTEGEALYTVYLEQLVTFILKRYNQTLLEARGIDVASLSSGPLYKWAETNTENVFGRDITLTCITRNYWPKMIGPSFSGINIHGVTIIGGSATPSNLKSLQILSGWGMPR